ncbi:MAG: hypothetical protein Q9175_002998 [Cornicularia normoerica]
MQFPLRALSTLLFLFGPHLTLTKRPPNIADGCTNQTCPIINARFQAAKDEIAQVDDKATTPAFLSGYWSALQDAVTSLGAEMSFLVFGSDGMDMAMGLLGFKSWRWMLGENRAQLNE